MSFLKFYDMKNIVRGKRVKGRLLPRKLLYSRDRYCSLQMLIIEQENMSSTFSCIGCEKHYACRRYILELLK